jgi:tricorn protease
MPTQSANAPLLIGRVSASQTRIAFASAGKIWIVDKNGGTARRLTNTPNDESDPIFSPDGKQIAFTRLSGLEWDWRFMSADGRGEA